jgi:lycopene beta-cyclase
VRFDVLRARLLRRLEHRGVRVERVLSEERCLLPMDAPLPALDQRTIGFGAAASFLHPASGYALVRTLSSAVPLAAALVNALSGAGGPRSASRAAWSTLWPASRIRSRRLHQFGLYSLARMDAERTRAFFASFFSLPTDSQAAFLADNLPPGRLAALMANLFSEAPPQVRWAMVTGGAAASGSLFRALAGA